MKICVIRERQIFLCSEESSYISGSALIGVTGDIEAMVFYAGKSVDNIESIKSAKSIIEDIWDEYLNCQNQNI